ncbi:MAG: hypothetical protein ACTSRF_14555 [Candidatus Freyarchaeota archaeon]
MIKDLGGKYWSYVCTKGIPIVQNFAGLVDSLKIGEVLDFKAENQEKRCTIKLIIL